MLRGDPIPSFRCPSVSGEEYGPEDVRGTRGLVVLFLSVTCPYVLAQEKRLLSLAERYTQQGVAFVAICSNSDPSLAPGNTPEDVARHAEAQNYPFPYLYDQSQSLATAFGAQCTPDIFLFDAELRLRYHGRLDDNWRDATQVKVRHLEMDIDSMLRGEPPSEDQHPSFGCAIKWNPGPVLRLPTALVASAHLRVLLQPGTTRVVNTIDGTLLEGSADLVTFLRSFRTPTTLAEVGRRVPLPPNAEEITRNLVEIGFLVRPGEDELRSLRARIARRRERVASGSLVSILRLNLATGCNLRCTYCYMEAPMVNRGKEEHAAMMKRPTAKAAIDAFIQNAVTNGRRYVSIRYIGGEPLLNPVVLRWSMEYAEALGAEHGIAVTHLVCTNGLLLNRDFAKFLKSLSDAHVLISLDGLKDVNDAMRVDRQGRGTYDRVVGAIQMLIDEGVPLGVPAVIGEEGLANVSEFLDEMDRLGVRRVGLNPSYRFAGSGPSETDLRTLVDGFVEARSHALELGLELSGKAYLPEWHALHGHIANCEAMGRALVIDPNGSVSLCDKLDEVVGHIDDLPAVFRTETYERFAMRVRGNIDACAECEVRWLCNGGCLAEARAESGGDDLPESSCTFIRQMAARILMPLESFDVTAATRT